MRKIWMVCLFVGTGAALLAAQAEHSKLQRVTVERPNVVIRGAFLGKVEIWAVPTGTGITPDEDVLLGVAKRKNAAGSKEVWIFSIPPCATETRLLATEIFAKAFDADGKLVGQKSLPYVGASAVHDALCGAH